jgi:FkbM family methyltransferase
MSGAVTVSDTREFTQQEWRKHKRRTARNIRHAHAQGLLQGILSMLRPGDVVLDCGANLGDVTQPLCDTGALVHAFEPDLYAFEQLTARVGRCENVVLHNAAVGVCSGAIKLMRARNFDDNPKGGSVKSTVVTGGRQIDEAEGIEVALISLPEMLRELTQRHGRIAFLKMDIEGAELDLLEVMLAQDLFEHIDLTVAETHERKFRDLRPRFAALRDEIEARYPITKVNLDWI